MRAPTWEHLLRPENRVELQPPADCDHIARVEQDLSIELPPELRTLYETTNGLYDKPGQWFVMWPLADLAARNAPAWIEWETEARRRFLAFGDDGAGQPFCLALDGDPTVFSWSPIDQEATPRAPTLHDFWSAWLSGRIAT